MEERPPVPETRNRFPIQLRKVDVGQISYACGGFSSLSINPITEYTLETGTSPINEETKSFQVIVAFIAKTDPAKTGLNVDYSLTVRVFGDFVVIADSFPKDKILSWAQLNGTAVLLPFLRETVHSITTKSGFKPYLMPLVEAPLFKVAPPTLAVV